MISRKVYKTNVTESFTDARSGGRHFPSISSCSSCTRMVRLVLLNLASNGGEQANSVHLIANDSS